MNTGSLRSILIAFGGLTLLLGSLYIGSLFFSLQKSISPEVTIREYAPIGKSGGSIVPASCPSYEHVSGECNPPEVATINFTGGTGGTINEGGSITISWSCSQSGTALGQNFSTGGAANGNVTVFPADTTTYSVQCSSGGFASGTVTVRHPALSLSANPTRVRSGNAATLTWSASDVTSCTLSGPNVSAGGISGSSSTGALAARAVYTLTCQTEAGSPVSASVTITQIPAFDEI